MPDDYLGHVEKTHDKTINILRKISNDLKCFERLKYLLGLSIEILDGSVCNRQSQMQTIALDIEKEFGEKNRYYFYKVLILDLFKTNYSKINNDTFTDKVSSMIKEDFIRAVKYVEKAKYKSITPDNYIFFSYLETLNFKRIPLGSHSVVESGFSRSIVIKQPPLEMFKFLYYLYLCKGNKPLYELHYNPHRMRSFTRKGWSEVLSNGANLLQGNPSIKGIFGASWFFDPALKSVSPELSYLNAITENIGGGIFFADRSERDKINAFAMSKKRKDAYDVGSYEPTSFLTILPRKKLIKYFLEAQ